MIIVHLSLCGVNAFIFIVAILVFFSLFSVSCANALSRWSGHMNFELCTQLHAMAASNGHKSETTSSITTKRGIGMGNVAFSDGILLKTLSTKREARKVTESCAIFTQKCGDNTVDLHVRKKVPAGRKWGDEQILYGRASSSLASLIP